MELSRAGRLVAFFHRPFHAAHPQVKERRMKHVDRYALGIIAALAILAGCGQVSAPVPTGGTIPTGAAHGKSRMLPEAKAQTCPGRYAECITLAYGSPFEQQWCVYGANPWHLGFGSNCVPTSGTWLWYTGFNHRHDPGKFIQVSVKPNPGNPTEVTISERKRIKSSRGKIVFRVELEACYQFSGGCGGPLPVFIGIATE
jgi:hypothetical protein